MGSITTCHVGKVDYQKLAPCSIRTVVILPGPSDEPVRAEMESICLEAPDGPTRYFALSYTWNDEERDVDIILNNQPIKVTKQLGDLFAMCRDSLAEDESSRWWVDQLCINQEDDGDKAQQIPRMRTIYEKAYRTFIWLRPCPDGVDLAIDLIERLLALRQKDNAGLHLQQLPLQEILGPETEENLESWRALLPLMSHHYWTRTWILPEATANRPSCLILTKSLQRSLPLNTIFWLRNVVRLLSARQTPEAFLIQQTPSSLVGRVENFANLRATPHLTLFQLLQITRRTECSRPQDKVFSMLPFATDIGDYMNDNFIKPSYENGCQYVYADMIKWYILKYKNLNFLGACAPTYSGVCQYPGFDIPSWIPNWTHASLMQALPKFENEALPIDEKVPIYNACGPFSHHIDIVEYPYDEAATDKIFVSGLRIATVHEVLESAIDGGFCKPEIEMSWQSSFEPNARYSLTGESFQDAFDRTVVVDVTLDFINRTCRRSGKVDWSQVMSENLEDQSDHSDRLKAATGARSLFFAKAEPLPDNTQEVRSDETEVGSSLLPKTCESFMMGLGRLDIKPGDEVWALKAGQVLYVLRKEGHPVVRNIAETRELGGTSCPSMLWLNGKEHPWDAFIEGDSYRFVGECYVHGLMDGEALEHASRPPLGRPKVLKGMARNFEEIIIGGEMRFTDELVVGSEEMQKWYDKGWKIRRRLGPVEDGSTDGQSDGKERVEMLLVY